MPAQIEHLEIPCRYRKHDSNCQIISISTSYVYAVTSPVQCRLFTKNQFIIIWTLITVKYINMLYTFSWNQCYQFECLSFPLLFSMNYVNFWLSLKYYKQTCLTCCVSNNKILAHSMNVLLSLVGGYNSQILGAGSKPQSDLPVNFLDY